MTADELLLKIISAVKDMDAARETVASRSMIVGKLLLEAKKLHPKGNDFETFLKRVVGLHKSRAYELLALAGGRITDAEIKKDNRDRKKKQRAKAKAVPKLDEVFRDVTDSPDTPVQGHGSPEEPGAALAAMTAWVEPTGEPIIMTPKLCAALIRLRDADEAAYANPPVHPVRSYADKKLDRLAQAAADERRAAVDALCVIIQVKTKQKKAA
jgi:hypothetical protein